MTDKELTQKHYEAICEDEIANELLSKVPKQVLADKHTQITLEERRRFAKEILEWAYGEGLLFHRNKLQVLEPEQLISEFENRPL